jgi:psiF repeat-containing protein
MKRLLVAVGFASMMTFALPSGTLAQPSETATQPSGITPPAGVTTPGAAAGKTTPSATATKQKKATKQQLKMKDCAREAKAKGFKGDTRKEFMSKCLSAE